MHRDSVNIEDNGGCDVTNRNHNTPSVKDQTRKMPEPREKAASQATRAKPQVEKPKRPNMTPLEATIVLARRGNKAILPKLRKVLDEHPDLVNHYGSLTLQVQESWLQLIAGKDLLLAETMRRHLDTMRTELAGPRPSPLDRLLVDRILACHVQVLYADAMETTDPTAENMRVARYRMDRRNQAHRQFLSAVKMLATVRNLVARTNTIQVEFLNPPMAYPAAAPTMPVANGEQAQTRNGHANGARNRLNAAATEPMSGRINGNRMAGSLDPIVVGSEG